MAKPGLVAFALLCLLMSPHLRATDVNVAAVEKLPGIQQAYQFFTEQAAWILAEQIRITQIPAPPFAEAERARYFQEQFQRLGLVNVRQDEVGNVLGEYPGRGSELVIVSAHLDTVFLPETPIEVRRDASRYLAPGISDNSNGLVTLLALVRALREGGIQTRATLLFVANVGEEGEGDLRGVKHLLKDAARRERLRAMVVIDGSSNERLTRRALASKRFEVVIRGPGGHSWADFGLPNPVHALARVVSESTRFRIPKRPRTVFNVGKIAGGTAVNAIPYEASMKIDIRSESAAEITRLEAALRKAVERAVRAENQAAQRKEKLSFELRVIGERPGGEVPESARIVEVFRAVDRHLGIQTQFHTSSTDANVPIALGLEAVAVGGGGRGGASHSLREWYEPTGREAGLKRILLAVLLLAGVEL